MDAWINTYLPGGHISVPSAPLDLTRMAMLYIPVSSLLMII